MVALDSYRELFEKAPDAILIMEGDRFVDCNPSAVRMLRFPSREALLERFSGAGRPGGRRAHPADLSPPRQPDGRDSYEKAEENLRVTFDRGTHTFEWLHTCADGEPLLVEVQLTVVRRGATPVLHVVWRDISERKRLEAELRQAQRLEAVGRLAGGVAHDFNNLLMVILGHAEQLEDEIASGVPEAQHAVEILAAADRAAALTHQLLAFSRGQPAQSIAIDVGELLDELGSLLHRLIGEHVELDLKREVGPLTVIADPSQLEQLVVNLAANARDAMPDGGRLQIAVGRRRIAGGRLVQLAPGDYVTLTVTDSGTGMTKEQIDRAFDPFYTSKSQGKGTGLGLATVHAVAEQHGGRAHIESELGRGTTVEVLLPASERAPVERGPAPRPKARGGEETILLVEDEEGIRKLFGRALEHIGYTVLVAGDGQEALERVEQWPDEIDLLVTDMVMPRLSGPELVRRLSASSPAIRVLFMSGYSPEQGAAPAPGERVTILQKPFPPKVLQAEVRRLLDRETAASE